MSSTATSATANAPSARVFEDSYGRMPNENNHHDETSSFAPLVDAPMTEPPLVASTSLDSREDADHLSQPPNDCRESLEPSTDSNARNVPSPEPTAESHNRDDAPLARAAEAAMSAPGSNDSPPNEETSPPTPSNNAPGTRLHVDLSDPEGTPPRVVQPAPQKLTYADLLRKGVGKPTTERVKTVLTRPTTEYLDKLMQLARNEEADEDEVLQVISDATPSKPKTATATVWIKTGDAFKDREFSNEKLIAAIFKENAQASWAHLLLEFVQLNKARDGDIVVSITSPFVRSELEGQEISIYGKSYPFSTATTNKTPRHFSGGSKAPKDPMDALYFMDIVGIRFNFDTDKLFRLLKRLKTKPVFQAYRQHLPNITCQSNVWRVYFLESTAPNQLIVNGHATDQLRMDGVTYNVFVKDYEKPSQRTGARSPHCLDLDQLVESMASQPSSPHKEEESESQQQPKRPKTDDQPPREAAKPQQEEQGEEMEVEELHQGSNQTEEPQQEEQAEEMEVEESNNDPNQQTNDSTSSLDGRNADKGEEMEVDAKSTKRNTSQTGEEDGFEAPRRKKRTAVQQSSPTVKSWASDNFFDVLNQIEASTRTLEIHQDVSTRVYIPKVNKLPTDVAAMKSAYVKKQHVVSNKLDWHPDNLTMEEFMNVLQQSAEDGTSFEQHTQVIATTDYSGTELD
ncbi:hypothetical protein AC1031_020769, partial [Aphanomyces cochlioides]